MKLYFAPRTRAVRPRWLLEELEIPYDLVRVDLASEQHKSKEYLALNPFAELPVLVDGDVTLFEPAAVLLYLADRFPAKALAPPPQSPGRAAYLQWLLLAEQRLEPILLEHHRRAQASEPAAADGRLDHLLAVIDKAVGGRPHLVGESFTAADLSVSSLLHLAYNLKRLDGHPRLVEYTHRHASRPAVRRALAS